MEVCLIVRKKNAYKMKEYTLLIEIFWHILTYLLYQNIIVANNVSNNNYICIYSKEISSK